MLVKLDHDFPRHPGVQIQKIFLENPPPRSGKKIGPTLRISDKKPSNGFGFFPSQKIDPSDYHQRWPKISSSLEGNRQDHLDTCGRMEVWFGGLWVGKSKDGGLTPFSEMEAKLYLYIHHISSDMGGMEHEPKIN